MGDGLRWLTRRDGYSPRARSTRKPDRSPRTFYTCKATPLPVEHLHADCTAVCRPFARKTELPQVRGAFGRLGVPGEFA